MAPAAIHVVPDDNFDDWVVRGNIGQEFGHSPPERKPSSPPSRSRENARPNSIIHLPDGRTSRKSFKRDGPPDCSR